MNVRFAPRIRKLPLTFALLFAFVSAAIAQTSQAPFTVTLAPATTNIHWTLNTNVHTVHGTFKLKSGTVRINPATGEASGLVVIDATSGESGEPARDKRMHSAILESAKFPEIVYRPTRVDGKIDLGASGPITVHGVLTLHGQDHPLDLTVNLHPQGSAIALTTHFSVPFVAWGLKDPSTFIFRTEKDVTIDVDASFAPDFQK